MLTDVMDNHVGCRVSHALLILDTYLAVTDQVLPVWCGNCCGFRSTRLLGGWTQVAAMPTSCEVYRVPTQFSETVNKFMGHVTR